MPKKKRAPRDIEVPNPLKVNEAEFTEVIRKMVNTEPVERKEVEGGFRYQRRKNPYEGPMRGPVFDFGETIRIEHKKPKKKNRE